MWPNTGFTPDGYYPSVEYTIAGYIQCKATLAEKIQAIETLEALMLNSMLNQLGGDAIPTSTAPIVFQIGAQSIYQNGILFEADLSPYGIVPNPQTLAVTQDLTGSGIFSPVSATFAPATLILSGLSSPVTYPSQTVRIAYTIAATPNNAAIAQYELDDGQVRIKTGFRSIDDLTKSLDGLRKTKNIFLNQFNGRTFVLQDKRNFR